MLVVVLKKELPTREACEVIKKITEIEGVMVVKTIESVMANAFPETVEA